VLLHGVLLPNSETDTIIWVMTGTALLGELGGGGPADGGHRCDRYGQHTLSFKGQETSLTAALCLLGFAQQKWRYVGLMYSRGARREPV